MAMKSKLHLFLLALMLTRLSSLYAQHDLQEKPKEDHLPSEFEKTDTIMDDLPESVNEDLLKLFEKLHVNSFTRPEENCLDEDSNPYFPDSLYEKRMKSLPFLIPMNYNETVRKCIDLYAGKMRGKVSYIMGMSYYYFPMIEQKFDEMNLPVELKYLAIVESGLNPVIQSPKGAYGLWQFMLPTAKKCGLEINSLIDERLDPERATVAAGIYFQRLYDMFKDWYLVIAAYNCGEGSVLKAIRRAGGNRDFWKIFPYLPRETRSYLPHYIAIAYVMENHQYHGICPIMPDFSISTDTLMVERNLSFDRIADILKIDKEIIKFYNSQYKREIIPGNTKPSVLRLPVRSLYAYIDSKDSVYAGRLDELMALCRPATDSEPIENRNEKITHTVKAGENIYTVANLYGVTTQNLRKWNGLAGGSALKRGRKLTIHIDNGGLNYTVSKNPTSETKRDTTAASSTVTKANAASSVSTASSKISDSRQAGAYKTGYVSYTVKSGDTLSGIASKYRGITVKKIQAANGMTTTRLKIGQILKIPQV
jgi:membrane-bound lytic murein transglycosylase D